MKRYNGKVNILRLIDGAKQAEGLTVIIDVFRAFSLENYLYDMGAELIRPIGSVEEAFKLKETTPNSLLFGERNGIKVEGFDFGNSPSSVNADIVKGKTILHTTSAGTQGIANAIHADEIIGGNLVAAKAIAEYIRRKNPDRTDDHVCISAGNHNGIFPRRSNVRSRLQHGSGSQAIGANGV